MALRSKLVSTLLAVAALPAVASAAIIGGTYYATQYDFREFFAATDGRNFQVILAGNAFPGLDPNMVARDLLPVMQAAKPRPALTFTYDPPPEQPHPYYRLVLIFDPALDYGSNQVCAGVPPRLRQGRPGVFYVFAVYCRNDLALSETTAWTQATGPSDPASTSCSGNSSRSCSAIARATVRWAVRRICREAQHAPVMRNDFSRERPALHWARQNDGPARSW